MLILPEPQILYDFHNSTAAKFSPNDASIRHISARI